MIPHTSLLCQCLNDRDLFQLLNPVFLFGQYDAFTHYTHCNVLHCLSICLRKHSCFVLRLYVSVMSLVLCVEALPNTVFNLFAM